MDLVKIRFPFDEILLEDQICGKDVKRVRDGRGGNAEAELDGESCSSAFFSPRLHISVDREGGIDFEGKKIVTQKQKSAALRRKRASLYYGKAAGLVEVGGVPQHSREDSEIRSEVRARLDAVNGVEDELQDLPAILRIVHSVAIDSNTITMLKRLLEEEKSACVTLYQELEEERAAAASAADEALAMILRLQEDKAVVEMEAKQYQRMIDEKFAYDEEEMSILKDIIVRRETEIHFLKKEVEAYRNMNFSDKDLLVDDLGCEVKSNEQRPSLSIFSDEEAPTMQHSATGKHSELVSELSTSRKSINLPENEKEPKDIGMMFEVGEMEQTLVEKLEKGEEYLSETDDKRNSSVSDLESTCYDVHVIDDKTIMWKEEDAMPTACAKVAQFYILCKVIGWSELGHLQPHT